MATARTNKNRKKEEKKKKVGKKKNEQKKRTWGQEKSVRSMHECTKKIEETKTLCAKKLKLQHLRKAKQRKRLERTEGKHKRYDGNEDIGKKRNWAHETMKTTGVA